MREVVLIFPHQLFKLHPGLAHSKNLFLVEEWLFFKQYRFHKQKLILHRASMKAYADYLQKSKINVSYIEANDDNADICAMISFLHKQKTKTIHIADPADDWLYSRLEKACSSCNINLLVHPSPGFLNTKQEGKAYLQNRKKYFQTDFYIAQRKARKILLNEEGKPLGGQWSFDSDNRLRYPKKQTPPKTKLTEKNKYISEAVEYVERHFPNNPGNSEGPHFFAVDFESSDQWLDDFLNNRFKDFGSYEDAIVADESILHHSVLSPMINIGLIEPQEILDITLAYANRKNIPLNSTEGFVRQLIGWREFVRIVYETAGRKQRSTNYWNFNRKIPLSFYNGTTGIVPIDISIKKIIQTGYCHHIERLMVLGNFMLLCEFDPNEVYRWFMEMFIDAYDWVMVPNVYGMTQFADGGLMTTKPYISGSNYLMKMSDYEKGEWQLIWDALFWRFMHVHRNFFLQNPRLGMLIRTFDKMSDDKRNQHLETAEKYLKNL